VPWLLEHLACHGRTRVVTKGNVNLPIYLSFRLLHSAANMSTMFCITRLLRSPKVGRQSLSNPKTTSDVWGAKPLQVSALLTKAAPALSSRSKQS